MRKTIKAALFSILIFPGIGHFALGKYVRGLAFLIPALISTYLLVRNVLEQANAMADQLLQGASPQYAEPANLKYASWVFLACWIVSIADSIRLGRQADKASKEDKQ